MAKVPYSKLKCKTNEEIKTISFNDETIEVKQYLPIQEKLSLLGRVIELAHDQDYNYSNPVKADALKDLETLFAYTNITFTDKQKEDTAKLYDQVYSSGLLSAVIDAIPIEEINDIGVGVYDSIESVYKYQNSILGILDSIKADYGDININIDKMIEAFKDSPENLGTLREVLDNFA